MLSDRDYRYEMRMDQPEIERLKVIPYPENEAFQPASLDLRLGGMDAGFLSRDGKDWIIDPGEFVLATTAERIVLPPDIAARVEGKSSWGRKGLAVHITAGFIDPGFGGQITLELKNMHHRDSIYIPLDAYICQLSFYQLSSPAERPYGSGGLNSRYQNQMGVVGPR